MLKEATVNGDSTNDTPTNEASKLRSLSGGWHVLFVVCTCLAILLVINHLFRLGIFGFLPVVNSYSYYLLALLLPLSFLIFPAHKKASRNKVPWYDVLLFVSSFIILIYFGLKGLTIISQGWSYTAPLGPTVVAVVLWLIVLETTRRAGGLFLALLIAILSLFPVYTEFLPWILKGQSFDLLTTARMHVFGEDSILGLPFSVFANLMIGFIIFGVILRASGGGDFFLNLAQSLMGRARGGPAKVAILSSAFFGSISGSSVSNVMATGPVTIPSMRRTGFSSHYAGAVEAVASTGGVITPPIMGATAFIMANFLSISYTTIILAAAIPAILFYLFLFIQVDGYAAKNNLDRLEEADIPSFWKTLKEGWFYLFAVILLVYFLIYVRMEAWAPFYASFFLYAITFIRKKTRLSFAETVAMIKDTGVILLELLCLLAGVGLLIGSLSVTGVAFSFSRELVALVAGNALLMLLAGALTSFILGMGMTVTTVYIFLAIVLAPALISLGMDPLAVHLFIMYWGVVSFITPPVAFSAFAAASIANSPPLKTGLFSCRLGFGMYLVPFLFEHLAHHFLDRVNKRYELQKTLDPIAIQFMKQYDWPGNIRELENLIERLAVTIEGDVIHWQDLPFVSDGVVKKAEVPLKQLLQDVEKKIILEKLEEHKTTRKTAKALGISQSGLVKKMQKLSISASE